MRTWRWYRSSGQLGQRFGSGFLLPEMPFIALALLESDLEVDTVGWAGETFVHVGDGELERGRIKLMI